MIKLLTYFSLLIPVNIKYMNFYVWIIIGYLASAILCQWLYKRYNSYIPEDDRMKRIKYFYDINKIVWIISWIPIFNLVCCISFIRDIYAYYKYLNRPVSREKLEQIKEIFEPLAKKYPDDENIQKFYKELIKELGEEKPKASLEDNRPV